MPDYKIKTRRTVVVELTPLWDGEPTGETIKAEKIGQGRFVTAYRSLADPSVVYLRSRGEHPEYGCDYSKEVLANCDVMTHLPRVEREGSIGDDYLFTCPYYSRLTAAHKTAWKQYKLLAKLREDAWRAVVMPKSHEGGISRYGSDVNLHVIHALGEHLSMLEQSNKLDEYVNCNVLLSALQEIVDAAINYGHDYVFEFAPRNLAVDESGRLILLDPIFSLEYMERERNAKAKRARSSVFGVRY